MEVWTGEEWQSLSVDTNDSNESSYHLNMWVVGEDEQPKSVPAPDDIDEDELPDLVDLEEAGSDRDGVSDGCGGCSPIRLCGMTLMLYRRGFGHEEPPVTMRNTAKKTYGLGFEGYTAEVGDHARTALYCLPVSLSCWIDIY